MPYTGFCVLFFPLVTIVNKSLTPLFGLFQLTLPILLAMFIARIARFDGETVVKIIILIGFVNSLGGIIQYFISQDLFGLISNRVYDGVLYAGPNVAKRAISFFASPQSLAILLAFCIPITYYSNISVKFKYLFIPLMLFCGFLTGSKAFLIYLLTYAVLSIDRSKLIYFIVFLILMLSIGNTGYELVDRITDVKYKVLNISDYPTFLIWSEFLQYSNSTIEVLFGRGFGVVSTASQLIYDYKILNGSAESFFIQLYFEIGLVGLSLFCLMYFFSAYKLFINTKTKYIGISLFSMASNMAFSPAFYGFGLSITVYVVLFASLMSIRFQGRLSRVSN